MRLTGFLTSAPLADGIAAAGMRQAAALDELIPQVQGTRGTTDMMRWKLSLMFRPMVGLLLTGLLAGIGGSLTARAEHPTTACLLPESTAILLWIPDARDSAQRFINTALGRIGRDPQIRPLVDQFHASLAESMEADEEGLGLSLSELLALSQGELALAVVAPEDQAPSMVILMDTGNQVANARKLLDKLSHGSGRSEVNVSGTRFVIQEAMGPERQQMTFFEKDGTLVLGTNMEVLQQVLTAFNGGNVPTLAQNEKFGTIMRRSREENPKPQFVWYVDPIMLMRSMGRENPAVRMGLAMFPALGLDGLEAVGGGVEWNAGQLDSITHMHLLLKSPRTGVLEILALTSGDTTPQRWVPADVSTYTTLHWDLQTAFRSLKALYDGFRGEGALAEALQRRIEEPSGLDFETDLLPALTGRITHLTYLERSDVNRRSLTLLAWELKDGAPMAAVLERIFQAKRGTFSRQSFGGKTYYGFLPPKSAGDDFATPSQSKTCFGVLDDHLIVTNGESLYETAIATAAGSSGRLADALDFKLVASKIRARSAKVKPALVRFVRPEEDMRWLYDLAASDQTRLLLSGRAQRSTFSRALSTALENHPLPPFSVLQSYLAPGGGLLTVDEEGLHYTGITLSRKRK